MNNLIMVWALIIITNLHTTGQPSNKLINLITRAFPKAENVKWYSDDTGHNIFFKLNNTTVKIYYDLQDEFVKEDRYYDETALPEYITIEIRKKYPEDQIIGVTESINTSSIHYFINLKNNDHYKVVKVNVDGSIKLNTLR